MIFAIFPYFAVGRLSFLGEAGSLSVPGGYV